MLLSVLGIFRFLTRFLGRCTSNQNSVKVNFSTINFERTVCEFTSSMHYTQNFNLFTFASAKVILDRRPQNTFSKSNARCVLLSPMPTCPFVTAQVCFDFRTFWELYPYFEKYRRTIVLPTNFRTIIVKYGRVRMKTVTISLISVHICYLTDSDKDLSDGDCDRNPRMHNQTVN